MATPGIKTKRGEWLRACFDFIFGFENKKGTILDHWISFLDNFSYSPQEFYDTIQKELEARKIPGLEISRQEFAEGGLLSNRRMYLQMFRERLALHTCASSFGTGYYFSCWVVHIPALVRLWHILAALLFFGVVGLLLVKPLGLLFTGIALGALVVALIGVLQNAASSAFVDIDTVLLKIPVVSTIYEDWFRVDDSYWRTDTRIIYLQRLPALIKDLAEEITASKGAKLVEQYQRATGFAELYKPVAPRKSNPDS